MTTEKVMPEAAIARPGPEMATLFHALSEPTRLEILTHLESGEHRVRDLVEHLGLAQSTVSKHLACLRDCGLVGVRPEGRSSWFFLAAPALLADLLGATDAFVRGTGIGPSLRTHHDAPDPTLERSA
ncbi:ArsR/SmtB family transcription factor [Propioniciclava flava]